MEALGLKTWPGKAKVAGTFLSIGGAMILTFYKGVEFDFLSTKIDLLHQGDTWQQPNKRLRTMFWALCWGLVTGYLCRPD